jgi:hypothetical protein
MCLHLAHDHHPVEGQAQGKGKGREEVGSPSMLIQQREGSMARGRGLHRPPLLVLVCCMLPWLDRVLIACSQGKGQD